MLTQKFPGVIEVMMNFLQGYKTCLGFFSFRSGLEQAKGQALTSSRQLSALPSGVQPCAKAAGSAAAALRG